PRATLRCPARGDRKTGRGAQYLAQGHAQHRERAVPAHRRGVDPAEGAELMALDVSGIGNVGEFFSQHYLDALLESDLKDTLKRWSAREKDDKVQPPPKKLARLADAYFRMAARAQGLGDATARL